MELVCSLLNVQAAILKVTSVFTTLNPSFFSPYYFLVTLATSIEHTDKDATMPSGMKNTLNSETVRRRPPAPHANTPLRIIFTAIAPFENEPIMNKWFRSSIWTDFIYNLQNFPVNLRFNTSIFFTIVMFHIEIHQLTRSEIYISFACSKFRLKSISREHTSAPKPPPHACNPTARPKTSGYTWAWQLHSDWCEKIQQQIKSGNVDADVAGGRCPVAGMFLCHGWFYNSINILIEMTPQIRIE